MTTTDTSESQAIAHTILSQLGGRQFALLTGAHGFIAIDRGLQITIPTTPDGVNKVRVHLTPDDLYRVEFIRTRRDRDGVMTATTVHTADGIYCDGLQDVFEHGTGLYVTLAPRRH